jgi:prevent-host-death family protein
MADQIGIRALQQHASDVVRRAAAGEELTITDRGRPVARIVPLVTSPLEQLILDGLAQPATKAVADLGPPLPATSGSGLGILLAHARAEER